ncbi:spore germination protein [Paenibacillus solisilvae]|uniref:Spore germination protein n=1 Tax=Paenibacillus solisilvae TaxID=2486751 RepID=A0ABW0VWM2_9BACL
MAASMNSNDPKAAEPIHLLCATIDENVAEIRKRLGDSSDNKILELMMPAGRLSRLAIVYTEGLADQVAISEYSKVLMEIDLSGAQLSEDGKPIGSEATCRLAKGIASGYGPLLEVKDFEGLLNIVLIGGVAVLSDSDQAFAISLQKWKERTVSEPTTESVVRGPKDAFTESIRTNTALIRRKIRYPDLWLETKTVGRISQTDVGIMYVKGLADESIVDEVRNRIGSIDIDGILESGYIEESIQDTTFSPFPTIYNSERPDVIAAELLEGKVAILVDGTPFVLVVPALLISFMHSPEDYYQRYDISSLIRLLRFIGGFIALLGPSMYVAITTFHQEMLPTPLLISLASQREGIPFPAFIEAVIMEVTFEILREAGLRMPRTIGMAVSVVGTLVIGQAAVAAGIVSAAMVIVVSMTAISSFIFPAYSISNTIRMLRFPLMGLAASFGLVGVFVGMLGIITHLAGLSSFGVPYASPFTPLQSMSDAKDTLIRLPVWAMKKRPSVFAKLNPVRQRTKSSKS